MPKNFNKHLPKQVLGQASNSHSTFLNQNTNTKEFLANWAQRPLSNKVTDVVLHFLMSFQSQNTKRNYLNDIKCFLGFSFKIGFSCEYIEQINEEILLLWQNNLNSSENLSQISVRRKLNALSSLLEFSKKRNLITENPMFFIKRPKPTERSKTNAFTEEETKRIIAFLKNNFEKTSLVHSQNMRTYKAAHLKYAVISTLFSVGMRVNELCEIKIGNLEFNQDFARIHMKTKGNKEHAPFLHEKTTQILKDFIKNMRQNAKEHDYLFVRTQNVRTETKLSQVAIYNMITETAKKLGIDKKVSPHSCRATLATLLHKKGVPIANIQRLLNHNDITTTAVYIKKAHEYEESAATKIDIMKKL